MVATNEELLNTFIITFILYTITFELSKVFFQRRVLKVSTTNPQEEKQQQLDNKKKNTQTLLQQGPSYVCSLIHSLINGICGIIMVQGLWNATDDETKLYFPPTPIEYQPYVRQVEISNVIFVTYLLCDLFHVIKIYPKLGSIDTIIHHCVFLTCSFINGYYGILPFAFCWLIIGELSTIFLNIRWFLIKTGRGHTKAFVVVQYLFAVTFFVTRVVIYILGVIELFQQRQILYDLVSDEKQQKIPSIFMFITIFFVVVGCILNLVWFQKIAIMAFFPTSSSKSSKHNNKPKNQ